MRLLLAIALSLPLCGAWAVPAAHAQGAAHNRQEPPTDDEKPLKVPALQYTVAFLLTILILIIVCMPSRKSVQSD